jgi:TolB-like protein
VLPFTDLSEEKNQDWFCDGIAASNIALHLTRRHHRQRASGRCRSSMTRCGVSSAVRSGERHLGAAQMSAKR